MRVFLTMSFLLLTACEQEVAISPKPRPAEIVEVGERTRAAPTVLVGEVRSRYESAQGFRIPGKIVQRLVERGAVVRKGQVLAKLDDKDTSLSASSAQAELHAAEADLALAQAELERQRSLFQRKFVSAQALDIQEAKFKSAQARVKQTTAEAAVRSNQSRYTQLQADRDGVVTEIRAEPGQVVEAGEVVARIAATDSLEVAISAPESHIGGAALGAAAEIKLWALPSKVYRGSVREVAPAADSVTRTFQMRVALADADAAVHLGMTAGVRFEAAADQAWLLPSTAVTQRDGQAVVWVVEPATGAVTPRPVQTGPFREDGTIVNQGLQSGDWVVAVGAQTLVPGQIVQPVRRERP
ncbi:efflux RND transporter periplasmic adaptor subunit [Methylomonas sp. HW2-6]|uniref:efflux RND transporter periplasmic adaptor subunit n=1 Tax=Methylomonas sp. HW2-6 TaxID=3376687 RepID=UPI0040414723